MTLPRPLRHATLERCRMNSHAGAWELDELHSFPRSGVTAIKLSRSLSGVEAILLASAPLSERFIVPRGA